jgi:integrase/recombinase XerD
METNQLNPVAHKNRGGVSGLVGTKPFQDALSGFALWLEAQGYAASTVYGMPRQVAEFLQSLPKREVAGITSKDVERFMEGFAKRKNQRRGGGLSAAHINKQSGALKKFGKYLTDSGKGGYVLDAPRLPKEPATERLVPSRMDIQRLYAACGDNLLGIRDRAMLAAYYGCGLRKSEGLALKTEDVLLDKRLLQVNRAKNGHARSVPLSKGCARDLGDWLATARPLMLRDERETALFVSARGSAMKPESMADALKRLCQKAGLERPYGLHALRHGIATHLLQSGIPMEEVSLFLGHRSLESTQIYTHVFNDEL